MSDTPDMQAVRVIQAIGRLWRNASPDQLFAVTLLLGGGFLLACALCLALLRALEAPNA